jgi:exonuclease III
MTGKTRHLSMLTLNVNGLNAPVKRHRIANWVKKKKDSTICCLQETHLTDKNKHWLRVKGWKKIFQANGPHKKAGIGILIYGKVDFRLKSARTDNESHFILNKGIINGEDIAIFNKYTPNAGTPIYIIKTLMDLQAQIDPNTVIVGNLNIPLSPIDRLSRPKINKQTSELLCTLDQIVMVDIYRAFHLTTKKHTLFSAAHGTFLKIDHILGSKARLNKFKKIKITPCITSDHNRIKLDLKNQRYNRKYSNMWKLINTLLKD